MNLDAKIINLNIAYFFKKQRGRLSINILYCRTLHNNITLRSAYDKM